MDEFTPAKHSEVEVLRHIHNFMEKQGAYGFDRDRDCCKYLTEDGKRCAIGACLSKACACILPQTSYEGLPLEIRKHLGHTVTFWQIVQRKHDRYAEENAPIGAFLGWLEEEIAVRQGEQGNQPGKEN